MREMRLLVLLAGLCLAQEIAEMKPYCRTETIGRSVRGTAISVTIVDKRPALDNPRVKLVANMHGDETVGAHAMLYLGQLLCDARNSTDVIEQLLEQVAVYIVPSMNPDGYDSQWRRNANRVDLNRNFPDLRYPERKSTRARIQPETEAIMNLTRHYAPFSMCANFHGGALVVNYPYDGSTIGRRRHDYSPTVDNELLQELALNYSRTHPRMHKSTVFRDGITNGAYWYSFYGGMQDWNYEANHCLSLTIELSNLKHPGFQYMDDYWQENRASVLQWIEAATRGVHVPLSSNVTIASGGEPLVLYDDLNTRRLTRPTNGRIFHRLMRETGQERTLFIASARNPRDVKSELRIVY